MGFAQRDWSIPRPTRPPVPVVVGATPVDLLPRLTRVARRVSPPPVAERAHVSLHAVSQPQLRGSLHRFSAAGALRVGTATHPVMRSAPPSLSSMSCPTTSRRTPVGLLTLSQTTSFWRSLCPTCTFSISYNQFRTTNGLLYTPCASPNVVQVPQPVRA